MTGYSDLAKLENSRNCLRRIARHDEPQFSKHSIVNVMEKFVKTVNGMDETILVPCRLMDRQVGDSTDIIPTPGKDSTANQLSSNNNGKRNTAQSKHVHEFLNQAELFNLYSMLNALKNDLLWTGKDKVIEEEENTQNMIYADNHITEVIEGAEDSVVRVPIKTETTENSNITDGATTVVITSATANSTSAKGHVRRPSTASVASITSVSNLSDSESDSGMESDGNKCENLNQNNTSSAESMSSSSSSSENEIRAQKANNVDKATELAQRCRRHLNGLYQCLEQMTEAANYLTARYQSDIGGSA